MDFFVPNARKSLNHFKNFRIVAARSSWAKQALHCYFRYPVTVEIAGAEIFSLIAHLEESTHLRSHRKMNRYERKPRRVLSCEDGIGGECFRRAPEGQAVGSVGRGNGRIL